MKKEKKLTEKQQRILDYIASFIAERGYPPSVREIGDAMGLRSPSTVHAHLKALRAAGYLERTERKTRALSLTGTAAAMQVPRIPILGRVTAGLPILAVEDIEGYFPYEGASGYGDYFALRIQGDSMIGAGIMDGDLIIVRKEQTARSGQIVVALLEDEATCKRLRLEREHVWLMPENPEYAPIQADLCSLLGVVVAVHREYAV